MHKHDRLLRCTILFVKFFRISNALKQQWFSHKLKASANIFKRTRLANIIRYPMNTPVILRHFFAKIGKN